MLHPSTRPCDHCMSQQAPPTTHTRAHARSPSPTLSAPTTSLMIAQQFLFHQRDGLGDPGTPPGNSHGKSRWQEPWPEPWPGPLPWAMVTNVSQLGWFTLFVSVSGSGSGGSFRLTGSGSCGSFWSSSSGSCGSFRLSSSPGSGSRRFGSRGSGSVRGHNDFVDLSIY